MMRISDLLASQVLRADGTRVGRVREVRIVQDGPIIGDVQAGFRVDALLVGKGSLGVRLGYHAGNIRGPWLLNVLFRRSDHRLLTVPMTDVDTWDHEQRIVTLH
jgi:sporulation protein YlmC with PRC-barrel domain